MYLLVVTSKYVKLHSLNFNKIHMAETHKTCLKTKLMHFISCTVLIHYILQTLYTGLPLNKS